MGENNTLTVNNPSSLQQRYFNLAPAEYKLLTFMGCIIVSTWLLTENNFLVFMLVVFTTCLIYKFTSNGRLYYVTGKKLKSVKIMRVDQGKRWEKPQDVEEQMSKSTSKSQLEKLRQRRSKLIDFEINELNGADVTYDELDGVGLIYTNSKQTDSVIIVGDGSNWARMNIEEQRAHLTNLAQTTMRVASRPDVGVGVSFVFRDNPFNSWELLDMQAETGFPEIMVPISLVKPAEELTKVEKRRHNLHQNMLEVNAVMNLQGSDPVMAAVITIQRYGALTALAKGSSQPDDIAPKKKRRGKQKTAKALSAADVYQLPIKDVARTCAEGLKANGIGRVHVLNRAQVEKFVRGAHDVTNMHEFYTQEHNGTLGPYSHWPQKRIHVTNKSSRFDDTWHTVFRIKNVPSPVLPHYMRLLQATEIQWRSVSLVSQTVRSTADYYALGRLQGIIEAFMESYGSQGGHKTNRRMQKLNDRQEQLSNSSYVQLYSIFVSASASSAAKLETEAYNLSHKLDGEYNIGLKRIKGASYQEEALWAARMGLEL